MPIKILFNQHDSQHRVLYIKDGQVLDTDLYDSSHDKGDEASLDEVFWGRVVQVCSAHAYIKLPTNQVGILPQESFLSKLNEGQTVLVQVRREAIPDKGTQNKGPLLTQKIILAGRFCLYHPYQQKYLLSSKINDPATIQRFKGMFSDNEPITLRESATRASHADILSEVEGLSQVYHQISNLHNKAPCGTPYGALSSAQRWMRDLEIDDHAQILVDNETDLKDVRNFLQTNRPDLLPILQRSRLNLFQEYELEEFWDSLFQDVLSIPKGGNVVFDLTAAAIIIDVNDSGRNYDETNKQAIPTIVQQLKCRHLGGNVVIDFVGLDYSSNIRKQLIDQLKYYAQFYNLPLDIFGWSKLGWLEARLPKRRLPIAQRLQLGN